MVSHFLEKRNETRTVRSALFLNNLKDRRSLGQSKDSNLNDVMHNFAEKNIVKMKVAKCLIFEVKMRNAEISQCLSFSM